MRTVADVGAAVFVFGIRAELHRYRFRQGECQSITQTQHPRSSDLATLKPKMD
jgi:hypothetical protein